MRAPILLSLLIATPAFAADWVDLFDGKTLQGWRQQNGTATYRVADGAIVGEIFIGSKGLGFLIVSSTGGLDLTGTFTACLVVTVISLIATLVIARHGPRLLGRSPETIGGATAAAF